MPLVDVEFIQLLQDMLGDLEGNPEPIEVKIFGDDAERLASLAEQVQPKVEKIKGIVDVVGVQRLMLGSDPQVNRSLTTAFAYLLLPQVVFYGLSSVFMAILNTRNVFGPPAWAPALFAGFAAVGLVTVRLL